MKRKTKSEGVGASGDQGSETQTAVMDAPQTPAAQPGLKVIETKALPIALIHLNGHNRKHTPEAIEQMRQSLAGNGIMQPVGVVKDEGADGDAAPYRLVFGHRRTLGARALGWTEILATIFEPEGGTAEERQRNLDAATLIENLEHVPADSIDEAVAVAELVEKAGSVEAAAAKLGRSPRWVRDRGFLARLEGTARELVRSGKISLYGGRQIAKLADPRKREEIAKGFTQWNVDRIDDEEVLDAVEESLMSLAQVPWDKANVLPGMGVRTLPACDRCECNSANNASLFESDEGAKAGEADPRCTNAACYEKTRKWAEELIAEKAKAAAATVTKSEGKAEAVKLAASPTKLAEAMATEDIAPPVGVSSEVFTAAVVMKIKPEPKPQSYSHNYSYNDKAWKEREKARRAREALEAKWHKDVAAMLAAACSSPARAVALRIVMGSTAIENSHGYSVALRKKYGCPSSAAKAIALLKAPTIEALGKYVAADTERLEGDIEELLNDVSFGVCEEIARTLGVELPKKPGREKKAAKGDKAAAPSAKKKPAGKAPAKKAAKRGGGAKPTKKKGAKR